MNKIKKALIKVDAENKDYYEANYKRYAKECDKLDTLYKEETSKLTKKELVVAHEAFGYLCHAYGLEQMGIEGLSADDEPDPKQMSEVIRFAKEHQVKQSFLKTGESESSENHCKRDRSQCKDVKPPGRTK